MKIGERLLHVFREEFGTDTIDQRVSTQSCSAWDSLGHIRLLIAIECEFGFEPSPEEIVEMYSDFQTIERIVARQSPQR